MLRSPVDIKHTVLTLIGDLQDTEWVYWCIDDKYVVDINEAVANSCHQWVTEIQDTSVQGVMFCRCRRLLQEHNLRSGTIVNGHLNQAFVERKNYYQFWIHQFLRVGILRNLFEGFPDLPFAANDMDKFTGQGPGQTVAMPFNQNQKMYVSLNNHARFGESTSKGLITENCVESMTKYNLDIPTWFERTPEKIFMGEMS